MRQQPPFAARWIQGSHQLLRPDAHRRFGVEPVHRFGPSRFSNKASGPPHAPWSGLPKSPTTLFVIPCSVNRSLHNGAWKAGSLARSLRSHSQGSRQGGLTESETDPTNRPHKQTPQTDPHPRGKKAPTTQSVVEASVNSVGATGFEPATSCSRSRRATGLRYAPNYKTSLSVEN